MRLIGRDTNTRIEDPSTNLETVVNVPYNHKKIGLPNKSTQSPGPKRKQLRIVRPNRSKSRADDTKWCSSPTTPLSHMSHVRCPTLVSAEIKQLDDMHWQDSTAV
jgi:hypothetical protein